MRAGHMSCQFGRAGPPASPSFGVSPFALLRMACQIRFKERLVPLNNRQFDRMIEFGIQIAEQTARPEERPFVERLKRMNAESFFQGRDMDRATTASQTSSGPAQDSHATTPTLMAGAALP
jgi:hypothetical protein